MHNQWKSTKLCKIPNIPKLNLKAVPENPSITCMFSEKDTGKWETIRYFQDSRG